MLPEVSNLEVMKVIQAFSWEIVPDGEQGIILHFQKELFILSPILQMAPRRNPIHEED
jgi:hypothetical protein